MDVVTGAVSAAVVPTTDATGRLRALDAASVTIRGGFWADRLRINRERTIPHGFEQLVRAGNLTNLRLAAGEKGHYQALGEPLGLVFPFLDSDVYKVARGGRLGVGPCARSGSRPRDPILRVGEPSRWRDAGVDPHHCRAPSRGHR